MLHPYCGSLSFGLQSAWCYIPVNLHQLLSRRRFSLSRLMWFTSHVTSISLNIGRWKDELFPRCVGSWMCLAFFDAVMTFVVGAAEAPCWMSPFCRPVYFAMLWHTPFSAAIAWVRACGHGDVTSCILPSERQLTERHKLVRSGLRAHPSRLVVTHPHTQWINHPFADYCVVILMVSKI